MSNLNKIGVLENVIKQMLTPVKNIPLYLIIESICGYKIFEYDNHDKNILIDVINNTANNINKNGIKSLRPN